MASGLPAKKTSYADDVLQLISGTTMNPSSNLDSASGFLGMALDGLRYQAPRA